MKKMAWVGLDVHKSSITIALVEAGSGVEKFVQKIGGGVNPLLKLLKNLEIEYTLQVCYEAGCCGFTIYRKLSKANINCVVVAPSLIPTDNKKVKTDRIDAVKLAKYLRSGLLTPVNVPDATIENDRDLIRFREAQIKEQTRIKQQIMSFLLRKGIEYPEQINWNKKFHDWLGTLEMEDPQDRVMLHRYLNHLNYQLKFLGEINAEIEQLSQTERYQEITEVLKGFRGIETVTAMTIVTHVPDFRTFTRARNFMSYLGLTPGEYSSGENKSMRGITKAGSNLLRKAIVSIAQHYSKPDKVGILLSRRRKNLSSVILSVVQRADRRCRKKYVTLINRGKHTNKVKTAVAREVSGFIWEAMMYHYGGELKV